MQIQFRTLVLAGAVLAAPAVIVAQGPPRAAAPAQARPMGAGGVTRILNARRVLDLTPRQVAQLDSIERVLFAERRAAMAGMQPMRDSVRAGARSAESREARRDTARARMEAMRPQMEQMRRRDSVATAAAQRVLTEAQRQQWRELQAEQRGRMQGMREARGARRDGMRGRAPVRAPRDGAAPMRRPE
ncbi:MAG: hypothetical protein WD771_02875 [Gemmatimonadaceae bacterium]